MIRNYLLVLLLFCLLHPCVVVASDTEQLLDDSGVYDLLPLLPDDTQELLEDVGLDQIDADAILDFTATDFFTLLWQGLQDNLTAPFQLLSIIMGIILLSALFASLEQTTLQSSTSKTYHLLSVLVISTVLISPFQAVLQQTVDLMEQLGNFFLSFIPIFAAIVAVSGKPISGYLYHGMLIGVVELFQLVAINLLVPLTAIFLAISITAAATEKVDIKTLIQSLKSILLWAMGFMMTLFIAVLGIKSFVATSADSVSLRAGKFLIGSFIPVVGSALSDALLVIQGSLGVVKSVIGAFGMIAIIACLLPTILQLASMLLMLKICESASGILGLKAVTNLLGSMQFVLSFLQGILIAYGMMFLISTSLLLVLGGTTS